jgi:hypothetical protein
MIPAPTADEIDTKFEHYYKNDKVLEQQLTDEIAGVIQQFIYRRFHEGRRPAMRDAHAQDTGCVMASFVVDAEIPKDLQHGIFVQPKKFDAWIRFSNGNSEVLNSRVPDARGMSIKLLGVVGPKLLPDEEETQDFLMANNPVFFVDDLERYKHSLVTFHGGGYLHQFLALLQLKFHEKLSAIRTNFSWTTNPLYCQYWSMTSYRLGPPGAGAPIKFTARPGVGVKPSIWSRLATFFSPRFALKKQLANVLATREVCFDFFIQRYVDDRRTPVENNLIEWKVSSSKLIHVAKITLPKQNVDTADRNKLCEDLSFNPWHCLPEHKPLGAVNRARKSIYLKISAYRHQLNGTSLRVPTKDETA